MEMSANEFEVGEVGGITYRITQTKDLYRFHNPPYIGIANSGAGKTKLCLDILHNFGKEATNIFFVTNTPETLAEDDLAQIPSYCIRTPDKDPVGVISGVWNDIKSRCEAMNPKKSDISIILARLFPGMNMESIIDKYISRKCKGMSPDLVKRTSAEIISRVISLKIKSHPELMNDFENEHRNVIRGFMSIDQKTIFILDDVSESFSVASTATNKRAVGNSVVSSKNAFNSLLMDIFTRIRHYNCLCFLFLHSFSLIENFKSMIDEVAIFDPSTLNAFHNMTSLPVEARKVAFDVENELKILSRGLHYYFLVKLSTGSVKISRAKLHNDETSIPISEPIRKLHEVLREIEVGVNQPKPSLPIPIIEETKPIESEKVDNNEFDVTDFLI